MDRQISITNGVEVRKASLDDQEGVVSLLEDFYPGVSDHWRKIFFPRPWEIEGDFPGFVIVDKHKIVGFLGTIFSEHETSQGKIRICNLTTWYVKPDYRQHGMKLFLKVMKIPGVSWTDLTAAPHIYEWLTRAGFETLLEQQLIVLPLPKLLVRKQHHAVTISTHFSETDLELNLRPIHRMHSNLHCKQLLISENDKQCYCLIVTTRYKKIPVAKIYYMSNPEFFKDILDRIRMKLCWKLRVCYLQVEGDILKGKKLRGVIVKNVYPPRLYKSHLAKEEITNLGSELYVLGI